MSENKNSTPKGATNQENYIKKKSQGNIANRNSVSG